MATQPPNFISDEEMAKLEASGFVSDADVAQQEAAPAPPTEPPGAWERGLATEKQRFGEFAEGFGEKAPEALLAAINPMTYVRGVSDVAKLGYRIAKPPVPGQPYEGADALGGLVGGTTELGARLLGLRGARGTGETVGELLPGAIPVGGVLSKLGKLARTSRTSNIVQALGETSKASKANLERLVGEGRINLPISKSRGSLQSQIEAQIAQAGPELDAAKGTLRGNVPLDEILAGLLPERPGTPLLRQTPKGPVIVDVTQNPALRAAVDARINSLVEAAGYERSLPANVLQILKEEAQDAAAAAYKVASEAGQEAGAGARASELAASSIKQALETSTAIPAAVRKRLTAANRAMEPLLAAKTPLEARRLENLGKPLISRSAEMLAGRGLLPALAGAGAGAYALGPVGAGIGLGVGAFMQSALWNTLSAAAKARIAPILETEGVQAATQAAFQALIAERAENQETALAP